MTRVKKRLALEILGVAVLIGLWANGQEIIPFPRPVIETEKLLAWDFKSSAAGWTAAHQATLESTGGVLRIESSGDDPYLFGPSMNVRGPIAVQLRIKCRASGNGQIFWATTSAPDFAEERSEHFHLIHDNQWHEYDVHLSANGVIQRLRLDPAEGPGIIELASFQIVHETLHPLEIQSVRTDGAKVTVRLKNYSDSPIVFAASGHAFTIATGETSEFSWVAPGNEPFRTCDLDIQSPGLPPIHRLVTIVDREQTTKWTTLRSGSLVVRAAEDGSGARLELDGRLVGVLAPLISMDGKPPKMKLTRNGNVLASLGAGFTLQLSLHADVLMVAIQTDHVCEGPVLRAFGPLQQGLFAGLEYLAAGEHSSSTLDIETADHIRFAPNPQKVTMPLMAFVTDRATTAMSWSDTTLQPLFATPNFLDGPEGARASLQGSKTFRCGILIRSPSPLEDVILWGVQQHGLPPLPGMPRSKQEEFDLCLAALSNPPLKNNDGWGHCAEPQWPRLPYCDHASTLWRLTEEIPSLPHLLPNGSHIANESIYFVTGRAAEWLKMRAARAQAVISEQQPDGSFRYNGELRRGHFEDTASGYCAARACELLEHARFTGDHASLEAGLRALDYMKHFHDPRGAQTWEVPLHTPDILASAHLVQAYVRGYELTDNHDYLSRARGWAISGMPFVYQWSDKPVMAYSTIAVYGATHWKAPNWMGLPVQWCGYDYAYALAMLAPYDDALDWKKIATGILITAEQMQFPSGEFAGCEPDSFNLASQTRNGPSINPCAIVSLGMVLDGKVDSLAVAVGDGHRIVAPFPASIRDGKAHIKARQGLTYQAVIDGARIVDVQSSGDDSVDLAR